jgi:chemotaxis protein MotA
MFIIIGAVVVLVGVLGGFVSHGGPLLVIWQPSEFAIIGGAALGSLLIMAPLPVLKRLMGSTLALLKGDVYTKKVFLDLLKTMFELFNLAKREGLINIEPHIEKPKESAIFQKNPFLLNHHHALPYLTDTMKLLVGGGVPAQDLEALLDADVESLHAEANTSPTLMQKIGDALPGLGIVAAVLGIVVTMQAISGPPEEIGEKVGAALIGTFLGILMSYGFFQPMATQMEMLELSEARYFECIKAGIMAYSKGNAPVTVVEFARRVIFSNIRPSFSELENALREVKSGGGSTS